MFKNRFLKSSKKEVVIDEQQVIYDLVREFYPKAALNMDTRFDSLGFNSMMFIEFIIKLEKVTKIDIEQIAVKIDFLAIETIDDMIIALRLLKAQL
jgi:acyl carrier protein